MSFCAYTVLEAVVSLTLVTIASVSAGALFAGTTRTGDDGAAQAELITIVDAAASYRVAHGHVPAHTQ